MPKVSYLKSEEDTVFVYSVLSSVTVYYTWNTHFSMDRVSFLVIPVIGTSYAHPSFPEVFFSSDIILYI